MTMAAGFIPMEAKVRLFSGYYMATNNTLSATKRLTAGWQTDSKIPRNVRTMTRPVKFVHAAWRAKMLPQSMMLIDRYLAMGTRSTQGKICQHHLQAAET